MDKLARLQQALVDHLRQPAEREAPGEFDALRIEVYRSAVFRNVEELVGYNFPVLKAILGEQAWHAMVSDFMVRHRCATPLFARLPPEFVAYLEQERDTALDPPFLLELARHEWSESEVALDERELSFAELDRDGDLLTGVPVLNPIHMQATYRFPVHRLSVEFQPQEAPASPSYIFVYRNHLYEVGFMELNAVSARLIQELSGGVPRTGASILEALAAELRHPDPAKVIQGGLDIMEEMRAKTIILGTARDVPAA